MNRFIHHFLQKIKPMNTAPSLHPDRGKEAEAWKRRHDREVYEHQLVLQRPLQKLLVTAIDSETTGFHPESGDELISLAAVKWQEGIQTAPFHSYIGIEGTIPAHITRLTGISHHDVRESPSVKEVLASFLDYVGNSVLIGYYVGHDIKFINYYLWKTSRGRIQQHVFEVAKVVELLYPPFKHASFDEVCSQLGVRIHGRHTALGDALAVAELWSRLVIALREKEIEHLLDLYQELARQRRN